MGFLRMVSHPPGEITPRAILDVGRGCPLKCKFCYYTHEPMVGFEKVETLKETVDHFARVGKTHMDITGGEPSLCPGIGQVIGYAKKRGISSRMITSGQYLLHGPKGGKLGELLDSGLDEFLLSIHGIGEVHEDLVQTKHEGAWNRILQVLDEFWISCQSFGTNTVVTRRNSFQLERVARLAIDSGARAVNFIHFNRYYGWTGEGERPIDEGMEISMSEAAKALIPALDLCQQYAVPSNVRYMPYCVFPEKYRRHVVGIRGYMFDPSEHDNQGETEESFTARAEQMVRQRNTFAHPCFTCSVRPICDGLEKGYAKAHGWSEISPIRCGPSIVDPVHYRKDYSEAFLVPDPE